MKTIQLTKGKKVIVDNDDYILLSKFKWLAATKKNKNGQIYHYAARNTYPLGKGKPVMVYMHRVVTNADKDKVVDHKNWDTLDNRKKNLRVVLRRINALNMSPSLLRVYG